ncbi:PAS domain-containing methyl-accepting chemotaxis protein [Shinella granuli]
MLSLNKILDSTNVYAALSRSQAVIEFDLSGNVLSANENFCRSLGYTQSEILGKHHRIFCDAPYAASEEYRQFWARLARGEYDSNSYRRLRKDGSDIWLRATYNPVLRGGKPYKVVKFATDITDARHQSVEDASKLDALSRSQALIEFTPTGEILGANENFCAALGYALAEIVGKHHRMFCDPTYVQTQAYTDFWQSLADGQFVANEFVRYGKGGREIWIQAAYNPVRDLNGRVFKVVKIATDVTERMSAINMLGNVLKALAEGDLTQRLAQTFVPSMEGVRKDFNDAIAGLHETMRTVEANADAIASGAQEIRSAADDLAKRTEQQAASVEETAAALEEITTTVADSSRRADEAGVLVSKTRVGAEKSGEVVKKAISAMEQIEQSSREISSIIGVIDEIAFQTNLLALNAGVEAARAGEAGKALQLLPRRFENSRNALPAQPRTSRVDHHIRGTGPKRGGAGRRDRAGLQEILVQVQDVHTNVTAIVEASREQSVGLREINQAVNAMDQTTQQNAAMVEESTAASHAMAREADSLHELIRRFRLTGSAPSIQQMATAVPTSRLHVVARTMRASRGSAMSAAESWEEF